MKCLIRTFDKDDKEIIFFETATNLKDLPHCALELIVDPRKQAAKSEVYFKKNIEELGSEWSDHKKIIHLSKEKGGLRRYILT